MTFNQNKNLTNRKLLTKNILWNFLAQGLPLLIALFTIPLIIKGMGVDRFSLLTLIWVIIGYMNLFDFGLGRALTQSIASKLSKGMFNEIPTLIWTALLIVFSLGIFATTILCLSAPFIINNLLKVPKEYITETINSLYILALTLPMLLIIVNIKGILEAYQRFVILSILRIPVILFNYVGPLFILPFTNDLFYIVLLLVAGRIITFIGYIIACINCVDGLITNVKIDKTHFKPLLSFGSWITVSNIIGPIMSYMDRFILAGMISAIIIAYYTTPFDVLTRLSIIPIAIIGVMFPAFSAEFQTNKERTKKMYFTTMKYSAVLLIIPVIIVILFVKSGLTIWLDIDFAEKSYKIAQIIALGVFIEGMNQVPIALIQGTGRADITGKIILFILPIYLFLLLLFINSYGLIGAAFAWVIKAILVFIPVNFYALKLLKINKTTLCAS